jgi:hypothetical protein
VASSIAVGGFGFADCDYGVPRLSPDELSVYMGRTTSPGIVELYVATRSSVTSSFGTPTRVLSAPAGSQSSYALNPSVSADGLTVFFQGSPGIFFATRGTAASAFGPRTALGLGSQGSSEAPYLVGGGGVLYYDTSNDGVLHRVTLTSRTSPGTDTTFPELHDPAVGKTARYPVVRADELAVFWQASKSNGVLGSWDVYMATRAHATDSFSSPQPLAQVNTNADDYAAWLSPDGCRLYTETVRVDASSNATATLTMVTFAP